MKNITIGDKNFTNVKYVKAKETGTENYANFVDEGEIVSKDIVANGTYNASADGAAGYSEVTVNVPESGGDLSEYFNETIKNGSATNYSGIMTAITKLPKLRNEGTSCVRMFDYYFGTEIDLEYFNTSNVTNMGSMFRNCNNLTNIKNFNKLDVQKATDLSYLFYNCYKLTSLDLSNFVTTLATNMSFMFNACRAITTLDLSKFNVAKVTNFSTMFYDCRNLTSLDLSNFVTSSATNMSSMFNGCTSLTSLDVSNFVTNSVQNMSSMFYGCSSLTTLDLSSFDFRRLTANGSSYSASSMLSGCSNLTNLTFGTNYGYGFTGSANSNFATLNLSSCTLLTHDSLMDVINKLYDLTANGKNPQQLNIGATNMAKLTEEEIAIATNKGWTIL